MAGYIRPKHTSLTLFINLFQECRLHPAHSVGPCLHASRFEFIIFYLPVQLVLWSLGRDPSWKHCHREQCFDRFDQSETSIDPTDQSEARIDAQPRESLEMMASWHYSHT